MNKLALETIEKEIQRISFDANLWDKGIADYPYAQKCSEKRKKLLKAKQELQGEYQMNLWGKK